jgi:putative SOS response-associated peptidase YedK
MRWGLVPAWADSLSAGYNMINARSESISEKPSFRPSLVNKRCVVLADGYYEWKKLSPKTKEPYWIHTLGERVFAMAGLWAENRKISCNATDPVGILSATIITTASNKDVADVHDRMPAILQKEQQIAAWLDPALNNAESIDRLLGQLRPSPLGQLKLRRVSTLVNSTANDQADLLNSVGL